jgi:predicted DNA-binding protein (MmcQ/YjbR family)
MSLDGRVAIDRKERILAWMRKLCLALPGTSEATSWGQLSFRAGGRAYAVLEPHGGALCICFKAGAARRRQLLSDSRYFVPPHGEPGGWVATAVDHGKAADPEQLRDWIVASYRLVTTTALLAKLDANVPHSWSGG